MQFQTTAHEQEVREWSQGSRGPRVRCFWSFSVLFHWVAPHSLALALHPQNGDKYLLLSNSQLRESRIPERARFGKRYSKPCNQLVSIPPKAMIAETWDADSEVLFNFQMSSEELHNRETRGREERASYLRVALGYWYLKGGFPMTTEAS